LSDSDKQLIIALRVSGQSNTNVAKTVGVHPVTSSRTYSEFLRAVSPVIDVVSTDWRRDLANKAITAIAAGLSHDGDPFKRASLGISTLTGLGQLEQQANSINVSALISRTPEHVIGRYISLEEETTSNVAIADGTESNVDDRQVDES